MRQTMKMSTPERMRLKLVDVRQDIAALFAALGRQYRAGDGGRAATGGIRAYHGAGRCRITDCRAAPPACADAPSLHRKDRTDIARRHAALVGAGADIQTDATRARSPERMFRAADNRRGEPVIPITQTGAADR